MTVELHGQFLRPPALNRMEQPPEPIKDLGTSNGCNVSFLYSDLYLE